MRQEVARRPATAQSTRRKVPPMRELAAAAERPPRKADVRQQADRVVVHRLVSRVCPVPKKYYDSGAG